MVWKTAKADEKLALVRDINRAETVYKFTPENAHVETLDLPFYPGGKLVSLLRDEARGGKPLCYVVVGKETVSLDGSVANIHYLNAAAPLDLSAETIANYLKFRFFFTGQGWMDGVLASESQDGAFAANARILGPDGACEAAVTVSPRGEVDNIARHRLPGSAKPMPERFSF